MRDARPPNPPPSPQAFTPAGFPPAPASPPHGSPPHGGPDRLRPREGGETRTEVDYRPPVVGVVMGSDSDLPVVQKCLDVLTQFDIPYEANVVSAHRTPERAHEYASTARLRGLRILIAAAGGAAHLAGVMASLTTLPVIAIPMPTALGGADSLYATVQMPAGVPVATMAIGEGGATNAALLAAEILALSDEELFHSFQAFRADMRRKVGEKNDRLRSQLA